MGMSQSSVSPEDCENSSLLSEACEEQQWVLTHLSMPTSIPQSKAGTPLLVPLRAHRVLVLLTVRQPACPQHYQGTETLNVSAPASAWHCGNPATDSSLEDSQAGWNTQSHAAGFLPGSKPAPSCKCAVVALKTHFGYDSTCLQEFFLLIPIK